MSKVLDEVNAKHGKFLKAEELKVQQNKDLAKKYAVRYVPHLVFADADGKELEQQIGYMPLKDVIKIFEKHGVKVKD